MRRNPRFASVRRAGRALQRGQALIETAIVLVFAMTLFVGVYAVAVAVSDSTTAGAAGRSGARFGAEVGNNGYQSGATDACQAGVATNPCGVDNQIIANVSRGLSSLRFATLTRIVIYDPSGGGGSSQCASGLTPNSPYLPNQEPAEIFTPNGSGGFTETTDPSKGAYTLDNRIQTHPNEGAIGVQVDFTYKSPTPIVSVSLSHTEFTVNCLSPSAK